MSTFWESRYVDSGRDELADGGLWSIDGRLRHGPYELGAWVGVSDSVDYQELNLSAGYSGLFHDMDWSFAYTHLAFNNEASDNELEFALERPLALGLAWSAVMVHSFEADGSFLEIALQYPLTWFEDRLQVTPQIAQGLDFGYRTAAYDGPNHFQVSIDWYWAWDEVWSVKGYFAHSFAGRDVRREGLGDLSWLGLGIHVSF